MQWIQVQDGSFRQLSSYSKLEVTENGSQGTWTVGDGTSANAIVTVSSQDEANAILAALMQLAGAITSTMISAFGGGS